MDITASLSRTFAPKYTQYAPDGIGRDTYISNNNGGLLPAEQFIIPRTGY